MITKLLETVVQSTDTVEAEASTVVSAARRSLVVVIARRLLLLLHLLPSLKTPDVVISTDLLVERHAWDPNSETAVLKALTVDQPQTTAEPVARAPLENVIVNLPLAARDCHPLPLR